MNEKSLTVRWGALAIKAAIYVGNFLVFVKYVLPPLIIIFGVRTEVTSGEPYFGSLKYFIYASIAILVMALFLVSQVMAARRRHYWPLILIGCLLFLMSIELYEALMHHRAYGFSYMAKKKYVASGLLFGWALLNFFFWKQGRKAY